jgi:hypothetical protein
LGGLLLPERQPPHDSAKPRDRAAESAPDGVLAGTAGVPQEQCQGHLENKFKYMKEVSSSFICHRSSPAT